MRRKKKADHGNLRALPLFAGLPDEAISAIGRAAREVDHPEGSPIVREGGMGLGFHVVVSGKAIVSVDGTEVARLGPGEFFGEMALLEGTTRTATVVAGSETVRTLSIDGADFRWLLDEHPTIAAEIRRVAAERRR